MVKLAGRSREEDIHTGKRRWGRTERVKRARNRRRESFAAQHAGARRLVREEGMEGSADRRSDRNTYLKTEKKWSVS